METATVSWSEHLAWCKERALAYVDAGDLQQAFTSMASDIKKHERGQGHTGLELGMMLMMRGHLSTPDKMRNFIEGFN